MADDKAKMGKMVKAMVAHHQIEDVAAYLKRGREFKEMSEAELGRAWANAFELALGLGKRERRQELDDLGAEFEIRQLEPPVHLVEKTMKKIKRAHSQLARGT